MKKLKILWLWDRLDGIGGVETLLISMAKNLDRSKFNVYMGVFKMGYVASYFKEAGIKVIEIQRKGKFDFQTVPRLLKKIKELKIDVIHTHGHFPGIAGRIAGKLAGKKVISSYHLALHEDGHPLSTKILTKMTLPLADYVTFVSKGVEESFYNKSMVFNKGLISKRKHFTIYNGIDIAGIDRIVSSTERTKIREKLNVSENEILLLNAGRLTEQKGHRYLIAAMADVVKHCPNAKLLIFGEGELKGALEGLIMDYALADRIRIMPPIRDIFKVMVVSDIFVFPSLWEGFGIVLAEVMAVGTPVVASNVIGVNEIIKTGVNGILVESEDIKALSSAIIRVIKDEKLRKFIADNARKIIRENFAIEKMVESYEYLYEQ
jgi:glycosyltransferase involved in cell wall biosynthesis